MIGALGMATCPVPPRLGALSRGLRRPLYMMPPLVLVSLVIFEVLFPSWDVSRSIGLSDLLVAIALVTYLAAQYRLFSLGTAALPLDMRPLPVRAPGQAPEPA